MKVNKTQICNRLIKEADTVISAMLALKSYCNQVIAEQQEAEAYGGYRGDAGNDPDNKPKNSFHRPKASQAIMENILAPAIDKHDAVSNFVTVDCCEDLLGFLESHYEIIDIPEELLEDREDEEDIEEDDDEEYDCHGCCEHCERNSKEREFHPGVVAFDNLEDLFRFLLR